MSGRLAGQQRTILKPLHIIIPLWTVAAISAIAATPVPHGFPPTCTPIQILPISYAGSVSGCSSQLGGNPICIAGEAIQFQYGDGANKCCPASYVWQFESGPVSSGTIGTITHQFPSSGTYTVQVSVFACPEPVVVTKLINVAPASAIPTLGAIPTFLAAISLAVVAAYRLR